MNKILIFVLVCSLTLVSCFSNRTEKNMIKKEIKKYLKKSIKNPRSYKGVDFEIFPITEQSTITKYLVKHEYKAKDGIGTLRNEIDCFIYTTTEGILLKDPNCDAYKRLYNKLTQ